MFSYDVMSSLSSLDINRLAMASVGWANAGLSKLLVHSVTLTAGVESRFPPTEPGRGSDLPPPCTGLLPITREFDPTVEVLQR